MQPHRARIKGSLGTDLNRSESGWLLPARQRGRRPVRVKLRRTRIEHMSAGLPLITDIALRGWHGRKVPTTAVSGCNNGCTRRASYSITSSARASSVETHQPAGFVAFTRRIYRRDWRRPLKLLLKNHSIISVTRTKNDSGMVKPSAFAVVLLKTRSNLNGCSMGMSAGFEPRRILST